MVCGSIKERKDLNSYSTSDLFGTGLAGSLLSPHLPSSIEPHKWP